MFPLFYPVRKVIGDNRSWLYMATAIFMISAIVLFYSTDTSQSASGQPDNNQFDQLFSYFALILDAQPLIGILLIFMNNFISAAQMLILGVIAGLSPLVTLGINGALVGIMLSLTVQEGIPLLPIIVVGILPHGIFELFAFFICGAFGLKFGYHCIVSPLPEKTRLQSFRYIWKEAISVLPLVVLLLLIAAVIEILITSRLMELII